MKPSAPRAVRILEPPPNPGAIRSVYVHAPFCALRCFYCDFAVKVASADCDAWLGALTAEIRALEREGAFVLDDTLDTLYVGGGTPSLLGAQAMVGLLTVIGEERLRDSDLEWTAEANPESFTQEVAKGWRCAGVNRISLGIQSFHAPSLQWMGRLHGADGTRSAVQIARAEGFTNLSVDLIFGLPVHLERDHNSVYWSGEPYVGLGNGAHSYRHPVRRWNLRDWDAYRAGTEGLGPPVDDEEELEVGEVRLERIWLGLRTRRGISLRDLPSSARDRAARWVESALAVAEGNVVRLTPRGWLVMDRLTVEIEADLEG